MEQTTPQMSNSLGVNNLFRVLINVPYRQPGNIVKHIPVTFTIWKKGNHFKAFALCSEQTQQILNLPDALLFYLKDGMVIPVKQAHDEIVRIIAEELHITE